MGRWLDRIGFVLLLLLLAILPMAYDRASRDAYTTPKKALFSAGLCGLIAFVGLARASRPIVSNRVMLAGGAALLLAVASAMRAESWPLAMERLEDLLFLGVPATLVGALLLRTPARILWCVQAVGVAAFLIAVVGILQHQHLDWWGYRPTLEAARGGAPPPSPDLLAIPGVTTILRPVYAWLHAQPEPWRMFARLATQDGPASSFGHPNVASEVVAAGVVGLVVAAVAAFSSASARRAMVRAWIGVLVRGVAIVTMAFYLMLTGTRGAWVGLLGAGVLLASAWLAGAPTGRRGRRFVMIVVAAIVALAVGYLVASSVTVAGRGGGAPERPLDRIAALFKARDPARDTILERRVLWANTGAMISAAAEASPLAAALGAGPGNWQVVYPLFHRRVMEHQPGTYSLRRYPDHPHQDPLEMLAEGGLSCAAALALFWAAVVSRLWRRLRGAGDGRAAALALLAVLTVLGCMSLFSFPFHMPVPLVIIGLAGGAALAMADPRDASFGLAGFTAAAGRASSRLGIAGLFFGVVTALGGAREGALASCVAGGVAALIASRARRPALVCGILFAAGALGAVAAHPVFASALGAFDADVIVAALTLLAVAALPLDAPLVAGPSFTRGLASVAVVACVIATLSGSSRVAASRHLQTALDAAWGARFIPADRGGAEQRAREGFDLATAIDPSNFLGEVARADFLAATSYLEDARASAERTLVVHPWLINARVKLAEIAMVRGEDELAMREARAARALNPDAAEPHALMGELFFRQGRPELAVQEIDRAIDLTPDRWNPRAKIRAAEVLTAAAMDLPRVLRLLGEAEREAEDDADLIARIANLYSAGGAPPEFQRKAQSLWERVAALRPHDPVAKLRITVAPLVSGEPAREELLAVLGALDGMIAAQPDFDPARVRYFRGLALEKLGRREEALRAYREVALLAAVAPFRQRSDDAELDAAIEALRSLQENETRPAGR